MACDARKNFLNFFQKPIDNGVKVWYIGIIKGRGKTARHRKDIEP